MTPELNPEIRQGVHRQELERRMADIRRMIESDIYSPGAKKALEENLKQIKRELAELIDSSEEQEKLAA